MMSIQVDPGAAATWVMDRTARMRIGEHRRLDMVLLLIGALLVGGAAAIGAVVGDSERISGLWPVPRSAATAVPALSR